MQLQKWTIVNRRYFSDESRLSQEEWRTMIRDGVINGKIIGNYTFIDIDQLASCTELGTTARNDIPDLLA